MHLVDRNSALWSYLPEEARGLIQDGESLVVHAEEHREQITDYSYLVFPFSKAYEGFLKKFFLDLKMIRRDEFYSDDIRIGKLLNPHYMKERGSLFALLCHHDSGGEDVSHMLWRVWKKGRNQVFHYFPQNFRKLTYDEATDIINEVVLAMNTATGKCEIRRPAGKKLTLEHISAIF